MEKLHGKVDTLQILTFNRQITRLGGSATEHHGVELFAEFRCRDMDADSSVRNKLNAFLSHEIDAPLDDGLVELHVGNPVHQQPTDAVGTLVYGYPVTGTVQLRCTGKPRRTRTDHSHLLASTLLRRICAYPAFGKSLVDDRTL